MVAQSGAHLQSRAGGMAGSSTKGTAVTPETVVVVGASAGGVETLREFVAKLGPDFPAPVLVVLHMPANSPSVLSDILSRHGPLPAAPAHDQQPLEPGRIYVAPPGHHLLIADGHASLTRGPQENGHRPAIDPLFRSAALAHGPRAVGVVLSGTLDDGAAGLAAIAQRGGRAIVQEEADALYPGMPRAALTAVPDAKTAPARDVGPLLAQMLEDEHETLDVPAPAQRLLERELAVAELDPTELADPQRPGSMTGLSCPDCHGPLFQLGEQPPRYRCRVGHAWSVETLAAEQAESVENALWLALRTLEDKARLHRKIADSADSRDAQHVVRTSREAADQADANAHTIRTLLTGQDRVRGHVG